MILSISSQGLLSVLNLLPGENGRPSNRDSTKSGICADGKEEEDVEKLVDDETGKMIDEETSETGRVTFLFGFTH